MLILGLFHDIGFDFIPDLISDDVRDIGDAHGIVVRIRWDRRSRSARHCYLRRDHGGLRRCRLRARGRRFLLGLLDEVGGVILGDETALHH